MDGVWEVTHLGGHRFSPTLLILPFGYAYGRARAPHVREVLQGVREGRVVVTGTLDGNYTTFEIADF